MRKQTRLLAQGAMIAALYVLLAHFQNLLFAGSGSYAIQFRVAEALCVLAFFTPAAIQGLSLGCLLFNLTSGAALPLDLLVGSLATFLSVGGMRLCRRWPVPALALPVLCNSLLVGWELAVYAGGGFWMNAGCVALGEGAVMLLLGLPLYLAIKARKLKSHLTVM